MKKSRMILYGTALLFLIAMIVIIKRHTPEETAQMRLPDPPKASANAKPSFDRSPAMQAKRKEIIDNLIAAGGIREIVVHGNGVPYVPVSQDFINADFKAKQNIVSTIYLLYFDGSRDLDYVQLVDARTNKAVGSYSYPGGLHWK